LCDTDQINRASFEREGRATWPVEGAMVGVVRTDGAARHAGQSAEWV
jgi:hypothetical protein